VYREERRGQRNVPAKRWDDPHHRHRPNPVAALSPERGPSCPKRCWTHTSGVPHLPNELPRAAGHTPPASTPRHTHELLDTHLRRRWSRSTPVLGRGVTDRQRDGRERGSTGRSDARDRASSGIAAPAPIACGHRSRWTDKPAPPTGSTCPSRAILPRRRCGVGIGGDTPASDPGRRTLPHRASLPPTTRRGFPCCLP
jgi:hypothetical protein